MSQPSPNSDGPHAPERVDGPPRELPPVEPPSAGFILQLFIIPALIVAVLIAVVALFGKLAEGRRDASAYVEAIRSGNANVRWRAAYELASLIHNEEELAEDPTLFGNLTVLLQEQLSRPDSDSDPVVMQYLAASLGVFRTTEAHASGGRRVDPLGVLAEALAPGRPLEVRVAATESLARHIARQDGRLDSPAARAALLTASKDEDPSLRRRAVFALGFLDDEQATATLQDLLTTDPDRFVRYNAANALVRRGDESAVPVLREMLRLSDLKDTGAAGTPEEDRRTIEAVQVEALSALRAAVSAGHPELARPLRAELAELARSDLATVRLDARSLLQSLQSSP